MDPLYDFPLLHDLAPAELQWLIDHSAERRLAEGDYFVREGEPFRLFYIVLEGELQVTRTLPGEVVVMGTTPRGVIDGETGILLDTPAAVTSRAIAPCRLMVFDEPSFRQIFAVCPKVGSRILQIAAQRLAGLGSAAGQTEKLSSLNKISAALTHELNNPATAAQRAAQSLGDMWPRLEDLTFQLGAAGLSLDQLEALDALRRPPQPGLSLDPVARSDREAAMADWLTARGAGHGWDHAALYIAAGLAPADLEPALSALPENVQLLALDWLSQALCVSDLLDQSSRSIRRIVNLVTAVKAYTYLDQGPLQEVDVHAGLDGTLTVLGQRLAGVTVMRRYARELPRLTARGGELNQVWTHLIENAADALDGRGEIQVITRPENNFVMVEIADNGPGIAPENLTRVFEPFFTTKPAGTSVGLGLNTVYRIVRQHRGTVEVQSQAGLTRLIVRLPVGTEPLGA